jgi:hypothetical protein
VTNARELMMMAEIRGLDGSLLRRPIDHIDVTEALVTSGYSVALVEAERRERKADGSGGVRAADLETPFPISPTPPPWGHP